MCLENLQYPDAFININIRQRKRNTSTCLFTF